MNDKATVLDNTLNDLSYLKNCDDTNVDTNIFHLKLNIIDDKKNYLKS